jgi:hypothetical protein
VLRAFRERVVARQLGDTGIVTAAPHQLDPAFRVPGSTSDGSGGNELGVGSALLGVRTMEQLDDLLAGVEVALPDNVLDRIDEIVPPGTDIGTLDQAYVPPAIQQTQLRRRPPSERSAA